VSRTVSAHALKEQEKEKKIIGLGPDNKVFILFAGTVAADCTDLGFPLSNGNFPPSPTNLIRSSGQGEGWCPNYL